MWSPSRILIIEGRAIIKTEKTTVNICLVPNKNGISYNLKSIRKF